MRIRLVLAALCLPAALAAQATVTVPLQDPVYRDLDRLFDAGLVKTMLVGQRPYTRREVARIILDASTTPRGVELAGRQNTRHDEGRPPLTEANRRLIARLSREYATEIGMLRGDTTLSRRVQMNVLHADLLGTNSLKRAVPFDSAGTVYADINPLLNDRAGRTYRVGTNAAYEAEFTYHPARSLVFDFQPRMVTGANAGKTFAIGELEALNGTALWKDLDFEIGRQQMVLGQGISGGLFGAARRRPLDMVRLSNDTPFYAPSFLRFLGPLRGTVYYADLGPNQTFPHSNIFTYKLSMNPFTPLFELGVIVQAEQGGRGAPYTAFRNRVIDLIPILQYTLSHKSRDQISNKFAGLDWSLRVPELRGARVYVEGILDDADPRRWGSTFWQDAGYVGGLSLADLGLDGALSGNFEYHHTGLRYYEHKPFRTGMAFNRVLIGDPLSKQGDGGYLQLRWDGGQRSTVEVDGAIERRYGNVLDTRSVGPQEDSFHFITLVGNPPEWRHRATASWIVRGGTRWRSSLEAGYERVRDFAFVTGASRNNFLLNASVELLRW